MLSIWEGTVSWLLNPSQHGNELLEPKIRAAIPIAWSNCCEISRKYLRQQEPLQEAMEHAIIGLHHDLVQDPGMSNRAAAEILVKHYGAYTRKAVARELADTRRFVVLREIPDRIDFESKVHARLDLATVLESANWDQRDLIVSRYLRDESWKQVGKEKGISDAAAQMRCARIISQLRQKLGPHERSP